MGYYLQLPLLKLGGTLCLNHAPLGNPLHWTTVLIGVRSGGISAYEPQPRAESGLHDLFKKQSLRSHIARMQPSTVFPYDTYSECWIEW